MVLRPLNHPLSPSLQRRGWQALKALAGLDAHEQLDLACRNVVGALAAVRFDFREPKSTEKPIVRPATP